MSFGMKIADAGTTPNSVWNSSWNGLHTEKQAQQSTKEITKAIADEGKKVADAIAKIKNARKNQSDPVDNSFYIPADYRATLAHKARLALASIPPDFVSGASSVSEAIKKECFRDHLERLVRSTQPEDAVMNSTSEIAESARVVLDSLPADFVESGTVGTPEGRQEFIDACKRLTLTASAGTTEASDVASKQRAGRAVSYVQIADETDKLPSGGDPVNDASLATDDDTGADPLFDGYADNGGAVFNTAAVVPMPIVGSFSELLGSCIGNWSVSQGVSSLTSRQTTRSCRAFQCQLP